MKIIKTLLVSKSKKILYKKLVVYYMLKERNYESCKETIHVLLGLVKMSFSLLGLE